MNEIRQYQNPNSQDSDFIEIPPPPDFGLMPLPDEYYEDYDWEDDGLDHPARCPNDDEHQTSLGVGCAECHTPDASSRF